MPESLPLPEMLVVCEPCKDSQPHRCAFSEHDAVRYDPAALQWTCLDCYLESDSFKGSQKPFEQLIPVPPVWAPRPEVSATIVDAILKVSNENDELRAKLSQQADFTKMPAIPVPTS